jgi:hypothetical protein
LRRSTPARRFLASSDRELAADSELQLDEVDVGPAQAEDLREPKPE